MPLRSIAAKPRDRKYGTELDYYARRLERANEKRLRASAKGGNRRALSVLRARKRARTTHGRGRSGG